MLPEVIIEILHNIILTVAIYNMRKLSHWTVTCVKTNIAHHNSKYYLRYTFMIYIYVYLKILPSMCMCTYPWAVIIGCQKQCVPCFPTHNMHVRRLWRSGIISIMAGDICVKYDVSWTIHVLSMLFQFPSFGVMKHHNNLTICAISPNNSWW